MTLNQASADEQECVWAEGENGVPGNSWSMVSGVQAELPVCLRTHYLA